MKKRLLSATLYVAIANISIRFLGFIREMVLAYSHGASVITDAFVIAFTIPSTVLAFVGASAGAVYIPLYQSNKERAGMFTSNIINIFLILGFVFILIFTIIPQSLVFLFASQSEAETFTLAVSMLRIMLWSSVPILLANIYIGYLQIHNAFFKASISGATVNICIIITILLSRATSVIPLMAVGAVVGNAIYLLLVILASRKYGLRYKPYLSLRDSSIKEMLHLVAPVILATAIVEINLIIDRNFASSLSTGAISSLNYANKLVSLVTSLIGTTLATVLYPQMSEVAADGNTATLKKYVTVSVKKLVPILLPITVGVIILAKPAVRLLFERGAFSPEDTQRTAESLQMYAICFLGNSLNAILIKVFHSNKNTKTPAIISAIAVCINIILNLIFIGSLKQRGLALATGIASVVSLALLLLSLRRSLGSLGFRSQKKEFLKAVTASFVMGVVVFAGYNVLPVMSGGTILCAVLTLCLVLVGIAMYVLMHAVLRTEFLRDSIRQVKELKIFKSR